MSSAVCLHHPDGDDWDKHCNHWERLSEANTNCRSSEPFSDLVRHRTSHLQGAWIFYVGDHEIGADLQALSEEASMPVVTREQVLPASSGVMRRFTGDESVSREVGAALDYFLCSQMPVFIGNSVSPWSASQIVIRDTVASWYNSFGIPLADVFRAYTIPLVYTYTEESSPTGKVLLQISILSVKRVMPTASIHILYHGSGDGELRGWLTQHGVVLYDHRPTWRDQIEQMRLKGNRLASHLYANAGNYLGTWQRIDIPQFLSVEYCILLDSDAFVVRAFTIADIGHSIPRGLAFSSELNEDDGQPSNAGVALLNVPFLRESVERFHAFVVNHGDPNFARGPSDQGAYMEFYENDLQFLSTRFNMKPYYKNAHNWDTRFILHYHGLKPSDHIKYWFSGICEPLQCFLIFLFEGVPYQCDAMVDFAKAAAFEGPGLIRQYCDLSTSNYSDLCTGLLGLMADHGLPGRTCAAYCERALAQRGLNPADFPYRH
ncbi:unnamed protein product [Prorocentrum cordatum]|uniref:Hexosyltransferase n=1 Tax=Prorocentrum cordatum TaxID=2364126 RepID=A0ABN9QWL7_9DINO|nr:unnamed protein product [Polarella glacialis]